MGLAKITGYRWCEIKLSCFFHSLTGCNKTSFLLRRRQRWVRFQAVTVFFVKMNSLPEKLLQITSAPLNDSSQHCAEEHASTYMNIDMAR